MRLRLFLQVHSCPHLSFIEPSLHNKSEVIQYMYFFFGAGFVHESDSKAEAETASVGMKLARVIPRIHFIFTFAVLFLLAAFFCHENCTLSQFFHFLDDYQSCKTGETEMLFYSHIILKRVSHSWRTMYSSSHRACFCICKTNPVESRTDPIRGTTLQRV